QLSAMAAALGAFVHMGRGEHEAALALALRATSAAPTVGVIHAAVRVGFEVAGAASLALGDLSGLEELLSWMEGIPPGRVSPYLRAQARRFRGLQAAAEDRPADAERHQRAAMGAFREAGI